MSYKRLMASIHSLLASEPRERAPIREILDRALAGTRLSDSDAIALIECPDSDLDIMLSAAAELRDRGKGRGHLLAQGFSADH